MAPNIEPKPRWVWYDDERVLGWGSVALVIIVWEVAARISGVSSLYLPRPTQIVVSLIAVSRSFSPFSSAIPVVVTTPFWLTERARVPAG